MKLTMELKTEARYSDPQIITLLVIASLKLFICLKLEMGYAKPEV